LFNDFLPGWTVNGAASGDPDPFNVAAGSPSRMFKGKIGGVGIWQELRSLRDFFASESFLQKVKSGQLTGLRRYTDFEEI